MGTWICPNDRHLALRAKLGAGWSVHSTKTSGRSERLTSEETEKILKVVKQAEKVDQVERARIGQMVDKYESMRNNVSGNGSSHCLLCGDEFKIMGASPSRCYDCNKCTCSKCGVDTVNSKNRPIHLCKICSENRELWRKSGAWFYKGLPGFIRPQNSKNNNSLRALANKNVRPSPNRNHDPTPSGMNSQNAYADECNSSAHTVKYPPPSFARFGKSNKNNSDSSDEDEVNVIRKRVRPQESESDSDNSQTNQESKGIINFQSGRGKIVEQPITGLVTSCLLGMLEFSLHYNSKEKLLQCSIHRAKNLPAMDKNGLIDPYVKLHLLPGVAKSTKRRTKTAHKTRNPEWGDVLEYHGVTEQDMKNKTLRFSIFDEGRVGSDFVGETRVNLKSLVPDITKEFSVYLSGLQVMPGEEEEEVKTLDRGRILIAMMYSTVGEKLIVSINRCSNLIAMDSNGLSDPYVKLYLKPDKDRKTKHKTKVKTKTLNPIFNEDFYYPVKMADLTKKTLEVSVWDKDFGKNDFIGSIEFGPDSGMLELRHWLDVLKKPNEMTEQWHILRNNNKPSSQ